MPVFERSFRTGVLEEWDKEHDGNVIRRLFDRWALPGQTSEAPLRLGLRNGYLNFYIKGQSVAKLTCGLRGPTLSVHNAYVTGRLRQSGAGAAAPVQGYQHYNSEALADKNLAALVGQWIVMAESYASAEKRFVEDLIAANPGAIDLEMGLPASDLPKSERVAPRMDLVLVQLAQGRVPTIVFWEAKCANNSELRASGDAAPKVVRQVEKYVLWMDSRIAEVQQAYRKTAATLLDFHRVFRGHDSNQAACLEIWCTLATTEAPAIMKKPGIVIGNYWPQGSSEGIASGRMRQCALSFATKKHKAKLEDLGIRIYEVGSDPGDRLLPPLIDRAVSA